MKINNILLVNMAVLLVYLVLINVSSDDQLGAMIITMMAVFAHAGINLIASIGFFIARQNKPGLHLLLSSSLVLLVGCAGCFVSGTM